MVDQVQLVHLHTLEVVVQVRLVVLLFLTHLLLLLVKVV
jgi:hypothetical protein